jgi:5'-3' exoribonuclease 1
VSDSNVQIISTSISTASSTIVSCLRRLYGRVLTYVLLGSHPNDEDAHFRLSEEQIFTSIFAYVDHLFEKIKPKQLFFMAVDGVAPRAKMNQQRSRRFRTAKDAQEVREKAERKGEKLPDEKAFDSNCITPGLSWLLAWTFSDLNTPAGTPFMTRLSEQLRYFINKKITEDSNWRNIEVVLSGHEVPGEGEHKIMEYIRLSRAQPNYNANMRHCLYGLDADLIMLGLLSHDPHFCLLREEVKFGPARKKGNQRYPLSLRREMTRPCSQSISALRQPTFISSIFAS